ncbi:Cof subfamily protein (haloacid dehalogenase superfamily) [Paenibacillus shirakamiensis]|uniref:Cof subfamily protein (Haloacid dehalogenase superfamily) n=1 Tax=Paenibacillus shirakamiensis TaxID=1265935 RepID=A0ABS4JHR4_9BACL|nr:Cof-type HAD-IIB family hydrolase [Paenibacillus shirakamiensis]MBP2001264.1 Cof subfamily protein (haloacid dehalogenase superfamily) [Paenibacillus shirakamiensis]
MNYKLIALDVDGTLLNDKHELTPSTAETIQRIAAQGTEFVLCTGRAPLSCIPFMETMGLEGYVITHNGAATVDVKTRDIVHEFAIDAQGLLPYMDYCRRHGVHFDVNTTYGLYVDHLDQMTSEVLAMYHQFMIEPQDMPIWADFKEPIVKLTASGPSDQMERVFAEWSLWNPEFNMLRSGDYFIDLMHPDSSKGNALKQLATSRGLASEEVMAIGNFYNDITMLTFAGLGIAMDNSPAEVKAAAKEVTASNNDEGVRLALEKFCLSETPSA